MSAMSASLDNESAAAYGPVPSDTRTDKEQDFTSLLPPVPEEITVAGVPCVVNRVRLRELMLLARVVTRGVGENVKMVDWDSPDADQEMLGLLIVAIPESGDEMLDLMRVLVQPAEKLTRYSGDKLDADQRAANERAQAFADEMANPAVALTLDALAIMLRQEKDTIPMLVGKFRVLLKAAMALWAREQKQEQHNAAQRPVVAGR